MRDTSKGYQYLTALRAVFPELYLDPGSDDWKAIPAWKDAGRDRKLAFLAATDMIGGNPISYWDTLKKNAGRSTAWGASSKELDTLRAELAAMKAKLAE